MSYNSNTNSTNNDRRIYINFYGAGGLQGEEGARAERIMEMMLRAQQNADENPSSGGTGTSRPNRNDPTEVGLNAEVQVPEGIDPLRQIDQAGEWSRDPGVDQERRFGENSRGRAEKPTDTLSSNSSASKEKEKAIKKTANRSDKTDIQIRVKRRNGTPSFETELSC